MSWRAGGPAPPVAQAALRHRPAPAPTPPPPPAPAPPDSAPGTRAHAACSDPARSGSDSPARRLPPAPAPTPPVAASTSGPKGAIGLAAGGSIVWYDDAKLARELDGYAAVGAKWIRFDMAWSAIERQQGVYDWAVYDRFVAKARERGLNMIAMIGYTPTWARVAGATDDKYPPKNVADYGSFAQKVVERYAPKGVKAYELWNEPNLGCCFWKPKADAARYTELVKAAYGRMKSVDPSITVLTGGTAPGERRRQNASPPQFLQAMYANGLKGHFDGWRTTRTTARIPIKLVQALVVVVADGVRHGPRQGPPEPDGRQRRRREDDLGQRGEHEASGRSASTASVRPSSVRPRSIKEAIDAWRSYPWAGVMTMYNYYGDTTSRSSAATGARVRPGSRCATTAARPPLSSGGCPGLAGRRG